MITHTDWQTFLDALRAAGGSGSMSTGHGGRYPKLDWPSWSVEQRANVVIYAGVNDRVIGDVVSHVSPARQWDTEAAMQADYDALFAVGARFNDSPPRPRVDTSTIVLPGPWNA